MKKIVTLMFAMFILTFASASAHETHHNAVTPPLIKYEGDAPVPPQEDPDRQNPHKKHHKPHPPEQPQRPGEQPEHPEPPPEQS